MYLKVKKLPWLQFQNVFLTSKLAVVVHSETLSPGRLKKLSFPYVHFWAKFYLICISPIETGITKVSIKLGGRDKCAAVKQISN
jgi:hypothetical protein